MKQLRAQEGEEFRLAADRFDGYTGGRIHWVTGDNALLNAGNVNRNGNAEDWRGGYRNTNGDYLLNGEFSGGDRLITAVHESLHIAGLEDRRDRATLLQAELNAYNQLSPAARGSAVRHADRFFHLLGVSGGHPVPLTEPLRPIRP